MKTSILENLEVLKSLNFDLNRIYSLSITDWTITIQADLTNENLIYFQNLGYKFILDDRGYVIFETDTDELRIVLSN